MIFTALLGLSIYLSSNKLSKNKIVSFVLTIVGMYILKPYVAARAQLVTFILFSLTVYFIEMFLETHKKRYGFYLIIIPLLIANLHCAVFPFYFVLFLPYIVEYLWMWIIDLDLDYRLISLILKIVKKFTRNEDRRRKLEEKIQKIPNVIQKKKDQRSKKRENPYKIKVQKNPAVKWLILIAVIAAFTGFINPTGTGAYTYTYKIYQGNTADSINEHLPVTLIESKEFLYTLCMFLVILIFTDTKIRLSDLFMFAGLTVLALMSRRQISMFAIFCIPILVKLIADMFEKYDKKTCPKIYKIVSSGFIAIIIILLFSINTVSELRNKSNLNETYIDNQTYPVEASEWMLENLDVKNIKIYNEYNFGSYLLFKDIPVFIDSRCDLYSPEFNGNWNGSVQGRDIFSDALDIAGIGLDYNNKFEEYGVTHVISYSNSKLVMLMAKDKGYKCLYDDGVFSIYERL